MNAEEARRITQEAIEGPAIDGLMKVAYSRIRGAAHRGEGSIAHPFFGVSAAPKKALDAAIAKLREDGYTVVCHLNPDPGDPRSSSYYEVSW